VAAIERSDEPRLDISRGQFHGSAGHKKAGALWALRLGERL